MQNLKSGGLCVYTDLYWKDARWSLKRSTPPANNKKIALQHSVNIVGMLNDAELNIYYIPFKCCLCLCILCVLTALTYCAQFLNKVHIHIWHPSRMVKNEIQCWPRHTPVTRMLAYLNITSVRHRLYQIAGEKWQPALSTASTHRFIHPMWGVHRSMSMPIVNRQPPKINITHKRIEKK